MRVVSADVDDDINPLLMLPAEGVGAEEGEDRIRYKFHCDANLHRDGVTGSRKQKEFPCESTDLMGVEAITVELFAPLPLPQVQTAVAPPPRILDWDQVHSSRGGLILYIYSLALIQPRQPRGPRGNDFVMIHKLTEISVYNRHAYMYRHNEKFAGRILMPECARAPFFFAREAIHRKQNIADARMKRFDASVPISIESAFMKWNCGMCAHPLCSKKSVESCGFCECHYRQVLDVKKDYRMKKPRLGRKRSTMEWCVGDGNTTYNAADIYFS